MLKPMLPKLERWVVQGVKLRQKRSHNKTLVLLIRLLLVTLYSLAGSPVEIINLVQGDDRLHESEEGLSNDQVHQQGNEKRRMETNGEGSLHSFTEGFELD